MLFNANAQAVLNGPSAPIGLFVEMMYSTPLRLTSSSVDIDWNGSTWVRAGSLGTIDSVRDSGSDVSDLKFTLSSVPSAAIALALGGESARGKRLVVYMWVLHPDTHELLDVQPMWTGVLDQMPINEDAKSGSSSISVTAIHRSKLFRRPKPLRYTDGDQKRLSPGDRSLEYIISQSTHKDVWPSAAFGRQ